MRKIFRYLAAIAAALALMPFIAVIADVIYEPEDAFYRAHSAECVYTGRSFSANGAAIAMKAPNSSTKAGELKNGDEVYITYTCLYKGSYWGFTESLPAWINMADLLQVYDYISFEQDHQSEFYSYSGSYDEIEKAGSALLWPWPGADKHYSVLRDIGSEKDFIGTAYKDENSREWGFVSYLYGRHNAWICMSDPMNEALPAFLPSPAPVKWIADAGYKDIAESRSPITGGNINIAMIAGCVGAVVASAAVIIKKFFKPAR
ncbi:MAG: hypothetical protein FWG30_08700 [Eubacteriaceae bacterium]|nr:hypothetical protein [Eubacteriaceae bacterium]